MIDSAHNNTFREILKLANMSSSRKLKPREYYQIYSITCRVQVRDIKPLWSVRFRDGAA